MLGSSRRRSKVPAGNRNRPRTNQKKAVAVCFDALNQVHSAAPAPDPEVARSLKLVRHRLIALELEHNRLAGLWPQVERWAARASAGFAFFLIHPIMAWWDASGYPYPGVTFWANENVIASASTAAGWIFSFVIVARAVVGAVLGWIFLLMAGCLMFAWLFST